MAFYISEKFEITASAQFAESMVNVRTASALRYTLHGKMLLLHNLWTKISYNKKSHFIKCCNINSVRIPYGQAINGNVYPELWVGSMFICWVECTANSVAYTSQSVISRDTDWDTCRAYISKVAFVSQLSAGDGEGDSIAEILSDFRHYFFESVLSWKNY